MKRFVNAAFIAIVAALALVACSDAGDPEQNQHASACVQSGGQVQEHKKWGGRWYVHVYWCEHTQPGGPRNITDVWWS